MFLKKNNKNKRCSNTKDSELCSSPNQVASRDVHLRLHTTPNFVEGSRRSKKANDRLKMRLFHAALIIGVTLRMGIFGSLRTHWDRRSTHLAQTVTAVIVLGINRSIRSPCDGSRPVRGGLVESLISRTMRMRRLRMDKNQPADVYALYESEIKRRQTVEKLVSPVF